MEIFCELMVSVVIFPELLLFLLFILSCYCWIEKKSAVLKYHLEDECRRTCKQGSKFPETDNSR